MEGLCLVGIDVQAGDLEIGVDLLFYHAPGGGAKVSHLGLELSPRKIEGS
jgi:hypothetical protein